MYIHSCTIDAMKWRLGATESVQFPDSDASTKSVSLVHYFLTRRHAVSRLPQKNRSMAHVFKNYNISATCFLHDEYYLITELRNPYVFFIFPPWLLDLAAVPRLRPLLRIDQMFLIIGKCLIRPADDWSCRTALLKEPLSLCKCSDTIRGTKQTEQ